MTTNNKNERVYVLDTTLRDGEQSPGFSMDVEQKMKMAQSLRDLGVDAIEAGFAASSPGDFESVRRVASEIEGPTICSLARAFDADVEAAGKALEPAAKKTHSRIFGHKPHSPRSQIENDQGSITLSLDNYIFEELYKAEKYKLLELFS